MSARGSSAGTTVAYPDLNDAAHQAPDIIERLRVWPAAYGEDAMSSTYVGNAMKQAADIIEQYRADTESDLQTNNELRAELVAAKNALRKAREALGKASLTDVERITDAQIVIFRALDPAGVA